MPPTPQAPLIKRWTLCRSDDIFITTATSISDRWKVENWSAAAKSTCALPATCVECLKLIALPALDHWLPRIAGGFFFEIVEFFFFLALSLWFLSIRDGVYRRSKPADLWTPKDVTVVWTSSFACKKSTHEVSSSVGYPNACKTTHYLANLTSCHTFVAERISPKVVNHSSHGCLSWNALG